MHHDDIVMEHEFIENYNHGVVAVIIMVELISFHHLAAQVFDVRVSLYQQTLDGDVLSQLLNSSCQLG